MKNAAQAYGSLGVGGCLVVLFLNATIGGLCVDYVVRFFFAVNLPWWQDALFGMAAGQFAIPLFLVSLLLGLVGFQAPLFHP